MKEHIDDIFRDNIDKRSFEFQSELWDDIAHELDRKEKGKNRMIFWVASGIMLPLIFLAIVYCFKPFGEEQAVQKPILPIADSQFEKHSIADNFETESENVEIVKENFEIQKSLTQGTEKVDEIKPAPTEKPSINNFKKSKNLVFEDSYVRVGIEDEPFFVKQNNKTESDFYSNNNKNEFGLSVDNQEVKSENSSGEKINRKEVIALESISKLESSGIEFEKNNDPKLENVVIPVNRNFKPTWNFGFTAKGGMDNFKNSGWGAGVFAGYHISKSLSLSTSVLYSDFSGDFGSGYSSVQTKFGFGRKEMRQNLKVKGLSVLQIPIFLNLHHRRHEIGLGIQSDYVLLVNGEKEVFEKQKLKYARVSKEEGVVAKPEEIPGINFAGITQYQYNFTKFSAGLRGGVYLKNYFPDTDADTKNLMTLDLVLKFNLK